MNLSLRLVIPLIATLFSGCDSSEPTSSRRGNHEATATVQIFPSPALPQSERFLANQIGILQSDTILESCPDATASALEIRIIEGTDLLAVTAHHDEEGFPQAIVQAALDAYLTYRRNLEAKSVKTFQQLLPKQRELFEKDRSTLAAIIEKYGIPVFDDPDDLPRTEKEMFRSARQRLADLETIRDQTKIQIQELDAKSETDNLIGGSGLDLPSGNPNPLFSRYREALDQKSRLIAQGLGPDHPDVLAAEKLAREVLEEATQIQKTKKAELNASLKYLTRQIELVREMVDDRISDRHGILANMSQRKYQTAKTQFQESRSDFLALQASKESSLTLLESPRNILIIHGWDHH